MTADPRFHACILAGGSGERFWPMSRTRTPKHLLKLLSERTLLEETARRLMGAVRPENLFVLTSEAQAQGAREALPFLRHEQVIAEPARRDTAPAAALATAIVHAKDPRGVLALLPADAFIRDAGSFSEHIQSALGWAADHPNFLLTLGVKPSHPATGFGYLELGEALEAKGHPGAFRRVSRFVEKPDAARAREFVASGRFAWNAGMFVWKAGAFLAEAEKQAPELAGFIRDYPAEGSQAYVADRFPKLPKISVDYAIMEKAAHVAALGAGFDWDDVGTWTAMAAHLAKDGAGNSVRGAVAAVGSEGNIAVSNGRVIALCGVKDLVVVETADAILVCHRDAVQELKKLQPLLPKEVL